MLVTNIPPSPGNLYPSDQRRNGGLRRTVFLSAPYLEYLTGEICDKKEPIPKQTDIFDLLYCHWYHSKLETLSQ